LDVVEDQFEQALNSVVCTTEQSSNTRKTLKHKILETVSAIIAIFVKIKVSGDKKTIEINNLKQHIDKVEAELNSAGTSKQRCINRQFRQEQKH